MNTEVTEVPEPTTEYVDEARKQGWVPKEEFRGNETDWVDAESFVRKGKEILPILKNNNKRLLQQIEQKDKQYKKELDDLRKATVELKEFHKSAYEKKAQEYETTISDLKKMRKQAITEGDGDLVDALEDRIDTAKVELAENKQKASEVVKEPEITEPPVQEDPPEVTAWVEKNTWYKTDPTMKSVAEAIAQQVRTQHPYLNVSDFLDKVDEELLRVVPPEKLGKKAKASNPMDTGSQQQPAASTKKKKSYESLPAEAKAACDKFVKQKLMTQEEYVKIYDWS